MLLLLFVGGSLCVCLVSPTALISLTIIFFFRCVALILSYNAFTGRCIYTPGHVRFLEVIACRPIIKKYIWPQRASFYLFCRSVPSSLALLLFIKIKYCRLVCLKNYIVTIDDNDRDRLACLYFVFALSCIWFVFFFASPNEICVIRANSSWSNRNEIAEWIIKLRRSHLVIYG